eukprot:2118915-Pyramimonas_sp.AAC.1
MMNSHLQKSGCNAYTVWRKKKRKGRTTPPSRRSARRRLADGEEEKVPWRKVQSPSEGNCQYRK